MSLATLTKTGRAAIALALSSRPIHLAWGSGDASWDGEDAALPSLVNATALVNELGRRTPATIGFVEPDDEGDIVIPVATGADGEVQEARYKSVTGPSPYLYVRVNYNFADASNAVIREIGVFMDTELKDGLPPGQRYFLPSDLKNPGLLVAAQIFQPPINRSPSVRQTIEFVLPI